ncbi:MAG: hypothetical protein JAZ03_23955 [Candidatus Thiodiazotropha taylori]|nr:hypothetical protein [Candidatus Thiodiazotropha taylori]MCG8049488.1 hypothetical protein [Candidatus Thiodiazotropha taylori]MCW4336989.1 reverse transcriptase domain-containing protein [Candidatus Thiodiazotropha endolucinida]MCW4347268.1 reverse transcriptase domain-containing protein [Candidatus Thiodiazotropha endolucinida]
MEEIQKGFYSTFFLVPKKSGELRPVINLRPLNRYLKKQHFKMDSLSSVLNLVQQGDWAISLDMKDAYMHIPIFKKHKQFLRFCIQGRVYQFTCLCFGPTMAPRAFTKIVAVVAAHLRMQNMRLAVYLDDWFLVNQIKKFLLLDKTKALNLLVDLGFVINLEKSALQPNQSVIYIGAHFMLNKGLVCPTQERVSKIKEACRLVKQLPTAQNYLHLLGLMASCIELVPNARLFMRPVQLHLLHFWRPASMDLKTIVPFNRHVQKHLQFWLSEENLLKGKSFCSQSSTRVLTTDASKYGYGGHTENQIFQGTWSTQEAKMHINWLEMKAVFLAVKHFLPILKGHVVLIRSDNTTVVQYVNKEGGTKSPPLCYLTWDLWHLARANSIILKGAHLAGSRNFLADSLSRFKIRPTEWSLNSAVVHRLFQIWGTPLIDLFASENNKKTPVFCTWFPSQSALAIDALSIAWENMEAYAFPPICLLPKVLQHMKKFHCQVILIAPQWPRRNWYTSLLQLLVACPRRLPAIPDLLAQPRTNICHPNPQVFNLTAWLLSTDHSRIRDFRTTLDNSWWHHGDQEQEGIIQSSSTSSVAGVVNGKLIPMLPL